MTVEASRSLTLNAFFLAPIYATVFAYVLNESWNSGLFFDTKHAFLEALWTLRKKRFNKDFLQLRDCTEGHATIKRTTNLLTSKINHFTKGFVKE